MDLLTTPARAYLVDLMEAHRETIGERSGAAKAPFRAGETSSNRPTATALRPSRRPTLGTRIAPLLSSLRRHGLSGWDQPGARKVVGCPRHGPRRMVLILSKLGRRCPDHLRCCPSANDGMIVHLASGGCDRSGTRVPVVVGKVNDPWAARILVVFTRQRKRHLSRTRFRARAWRESQASPDQRPLIEPGDQWKR
jgi:hypothetical protein